ncbi:MAG: polyprenol monophosphomannose synthase [Pirellulaceae bacterium]|nr:polyprenol monophosphomannose synthase [Pirellulaceae bacterium]
MNVAMADKRTRVTGNPPLRILVAMATFNEIQNLPGLVKEIRRQLPDADILVVDDNSPDGTGDWCRHQQQQDPRFQAIHRAGKLGLGSAILEEFAYAVRHQYDRLITLDADFSHSPRHLPSLLSSIDRGYDLAIGSRYVPGGGIEGWSWRRRFMSRWVNRAARLLLGLRVRDASGCYRCYRVSVLGRVDLTRLRARGFALLEEILWHLKRCRARMVEVPIVFVDRTEGQSKLSLREAIRSLAMLLRLGICNWFQI